MKKRYLKSVVRKLANQFGLVVLPEWQVWQLPELTHLKRMFDYLKIDCVFDVGANEGQFASFLRQDVGYCGQIISFEPQPGLAEVLLNKSRSDEKWHVEHVALGAESGKLEFHVTKNSEFSSFHKPSIDEKQFFKGSNSIINTIQVDVRRLDDVYPELKKKFRFDRPFLKMDTQGFDVQVVDGGEKCILEFLGLKSEISIRPIYENAPAFFEALKVYTAAGFELSALVPNNAGHFPRLFEVDCHMIRSQAL